MVVLGVVLLVLAVLLTLGTVFTNGQDVVASVFGINLSGVSVGGLFLAGVVVGAVGLLGLTMALGGGVRKRHKRVAAKREVRDVRGQAGTLEQENARLRAELSDSRPADTYPTDTTAGRPHKKGLLGR